jgi:formylglycine-generating enzyme required for sulfatase activity
MRTLMLLALAAALCAACADEPAQDATPAEPRWLTARPENAHPYADVTLARFRRLVDGDSWSDAAWNAQGTLEAVHAKTGLVFVLVPATGTRGFTMGSPLAEPGREDNETQHRVTVSAFLLAKTECTQEAWGRGGGENRSSVVGDGLPVDCVHWDLCGEWCASNGLRLPSESEWEYACRAGTTTTFSLGSTLTADQVNYCGRYSPEDPHASGHRGEPVPCGSLPQNPWGFHEVHGNVYEWCADAWHDAYEGGPLDGSARRGEAPVFLRVIRGGAWATYGQGVRSAYRGGGWNHTRWQEAIGLRPAADLPR